MKAVYNLNEKRKKKKHWTFTPSLQLFECKFVLFIFIRVLFFSIPPRWLSSIHGINFPPITRCFPIPSLSLSTRHTTPLLPTSTSISSIIGNPQNHSWDNVNITYAFLKKHKHLCTSSNNNNNITQFD